MLKKKWSAYKWEAGCDEAGRGCLAGPVVAAAVILSPKENIKGLNDSKKLSEAKRNILRIEIEEKAHSWAVAFVEPEEIDQINILNASFKAMHLALELLIKKPDFILVDGNRFKPFGNTPFECIVKGDGKSAAIAAASILAKTHRDAYMAKISQEFPEYHWQKNKGYPTKKHREAIAEFGISSQHRKSFTLLPQLELDLKSA
ncbi:MAG: ribonuclease HII [Luteibaculum sp.]